MDPNGAAPAFCRFKTLGAALNRAAEGYTVKATAATLPLTFTEPAFTVKKGVTLTTTDDPLVPSNYVLAPADSVAGDAFITLEAGASLKGFEVRNRSATGAGVATSCPQDADTQVVAVEKVNVFGAGSVTPSSRFLHGISQSGRCSFSLLDSTIEGAIDSGVHVFSQSASTALILVGNTIQRNSGTTTYRIGGVDRLAGGLALRGLTPATVTFTGNKVLANAGDQVVVAMSGKLSLKGAGCGTGRNIIACYTSGVGISSAAASVDVTNTSWPIPFLNLQPGTDYFLGAGADLPGVTAGCDPFVACPAAQ